MIEPRGRLHVIRGQDTLRYRSKERHPTVEEGGASRSRVPLRKGKAGVGINAGALHQFRQVDLRHRRSVRWPAPQGGNLAVWRRRVRQPSRLMCSSETLFFLIVMEAPQQSSQRGANRERTV